MAAGKRILGVPLTEMELERDVRRSHPSAERSEPPARNPYVPKRSASGPYELDVKDESHHPPPPAYRMRPQVPPVEQVPASTLIVQGLTWKAALPIGAVLTFASSAITQCAAGPNAKIERVDDRLADEVRERGRRMDEQDRQLSQVLQRQDRIETAQSIIGSRLDELRQKLRDKKE